MECLICKSNSGENRLSPGEPILETEHWLVEHAFSSALEGWLVIVLKRHSEALSDLTIEENLDFAEVLFHVTRALQKYFKTEKEYTFCLCELDGFKHIHYHVVPKHNGFDNQYSGTKAFHYLKTPENKRVPKSRIIEICSDLNRIITEETR